MSNPDHRNRIEIPPADQRDDELMPALASAISELEKLRIKASAAKETERQRRLALEAAESGDIEAAAAFARGKRETAPKPSAQAAREALEKAETQAAVMAKAVLDAESELLELVEEHCPKAQPKIDSWAESLEWDVYYLLGKLREKEAEVMRTKALSAWLNDPVRFKPEAFGRTLEVRQQNGEPYRLDLLLERIQVALPDPEADFEGDEDEDIVEEAA